MAFDAYFPHITLPKGKTDYRMGDGIAMICAGQVMLVDGFQGGQPTDGLRSWLAANGVKNIDIAVLTHPHWDHYNGLLQIEEDSRFHIKLVYMYDPLTLKHGCDGSANGRSVKEDMNNAYKWIRAMQAHGTRVLWIDKGSTIKFGDITWKIFREQPTRFTEEDQGNGWAFVNNGSLCLYSPETELILPGDGPDDQERMMDYFGGEVSGTDVTHHMGSWTQHNARALKRRGCVVAFGSCIEKNGPGTSGWTQYGGRRIKKEGIPLWGQETDIYIHAENGLITFRQGNKAISKKVAYQGKGGKAVGRWVNDNGWKYQNADGSWTHGWALLSWSKGKDWFYFNGNGYCVYGWHFLKWSKGSNWFYFDPKSAAMRTGWVYDNGSWYYLDPETGAMRTGWVTYKGKRCYLEPLSDKTHVQGVCYVNRTAVIDGKTYRFDKDGYATEEKGGGKSFLNGVDIASYQSGINPAKLTTTDFVIVKFTQGTTYLNPYADRQYSVAKAAEKLLGAYHYGTGKSATAEAQYFVKCLGNRVKECVLALDWEGNQNSVFGTGKDVAWCKEFLDEVYRLTGVRPLIYMSKSVCRKYNWSSVSKDYPLWCAQYKSNSTTDYQSSPWTDNNGFGAWERDTIRQYSSHGRIAGYDANIDLDLAYMSAEEWRAMAGGKIQTEENQIDVAISIAESYLGYHEGANNKTIFGDTMHKIQPSNMDANAAWCDAFVDFVILKTCEHFGKGAETARMVLCGDFDDYTYNSVALYKKAGRWSNTAHRGDQIFFGGSGHTGIVESVNGGTVHTIEGNKGDEVRRGSYSVNSPSIIGYGRPRYDLITGKLTANDMPLIKKGSEGSAVLQLQKMLNAKGYKLTEDGDFGSKTEAAVKAYQKANGLEVDGEVGEKTWASLMK